MIDWLRVSELRCEIGPDDFAEVAELFLMEVEDTLSRLQSVEDDPQEVQELMHFLKGSALNLGFSQLSDMCSVAERNAALGTVSIDLPVLKQLYRQSRAVFETEYSRRFAA